MKKYLNLAIFDEPAGGEGAGKGGAEPAAKGAPADPAPGTPPAASAPPKQNSYGLSEEQLVEAVAAYRAAQKAKEPDVAAITKERDDALAKVAMYEQQGALAEKGVLKDFRKFVALEVRELMASDSKLDTFEKAAEKYLKDHPQYTGKQPAGRMKATTGGALPTGSNGSGGDSKAIHATINDLLKRAALGK